MEFKEFKILESGSNLITPIKFRFTDNELKEEFLEGMYEKLNEYEMYLEYDCKGEFNIENKKEIIIEMIITFPSRKVPEDKKELEEFINRHVMDFSEYYYKINNLENLINDNLIAPI
ncbi:hypothetical protein [Methanobacterium veterum]|uniref:Uncharacterized protein n=1 Tax=Methanobacterium veterum TaxID=408577 RepID=A0A9E4ZXM9_9EURY|nr:hypothetical protein [Methanobacterium veterum]MCZ3364515.1 hypothetical protein [Methanobacterium veterum]